MVVELTRKEALNQEARRTKPRLVVFYSARSGRSRRVDGYLSQVLQRNRNHDTFQIVRVDADEREDLVDRLRITDIPELLVVEGRQVRTRLRTPRGVAEIADALAPWLKH